MHEYDIYELKEDQARLPNGRNLNSSKQLKVLIKKQTEEIKTSISPIKSGQNELLSFKSTLTHSAIYPEIQQLEDRVVQPLKIPPSESDTTSKRKRRVYVAEPSRCASLRSRQPATVVVTAPEKPITPPPAQTSPTPTEATEDKYIKTGKCEKYYTKA